MQTGIGAWVGAGVGGAEYAVAYEGRYSTGLETMYFVGIGLGLSYVAMTSEAGASYDETTYLGGEVDLGGTQAGAGAGKSYDWIY